MMIIRAARPGDEPALARIHTAGWRIGLAGVLDPAYLDGLTVAGSESLWHSRLADPDPTIAAVVAEVDEIVVGFAGYGRSWDPDQPTAGPVRVGELALLYVDPDRWRGGVGAALHDAALARLADQGYRTARLWLVAGNERARSFYRARGWTFDRIQRETTTDGWRWTEVRYARTVPQPRQP